MSDESNFPLRLCATCLLIHLSSHSFFCVCDVNKFVDDTSSLSYTDTSIKLRCLEWRAKLQLDTTPLRRKSSIRSNESKHAPSFNSRLILVTANRSNFFQVKSSSHEKPSKNMCFPFAAHQRIQSIFYSAALTPMMIIGLI